MQFLSEALSEAMIDQDKQFVPYEVAIKRFAEWYAEQIINPCEPQKAYTDNHMGYRDLDLIHSSKLSNI